MESTGLDACIRMKVLTSILHWNDQRWKSTRIFIYGFEHGVELKAHEGPNLCKTSKDLFTTGNVVADEPFFDIHGFGEARNKDIVFVLCLNQRG